MRNSRHVPASIFATRRDFGRGSIGPSNTSYGGVAAMSDGQLVAALFQHYVAWSVHAYLERFSSRSAGLNELSQQLGEARPWLVRKLHGQVPASLADMAEWLIITDRRATPLGRALADFHRLRAETVRITSLTEKETDAVD